MNKGLALTLTGVLTCALGAGATWVAMKRVQEAAAAVAPKPVASKQAEALLKAASEGNVTLEKVLPDTQLGYTAAIAKASNGQRFVTWISPNSGSFVMGALFDAKGKNLTRAVMDAHQIAAAPQADTPRPIDGNLIEAVAKAEAVATGTGGPIVYAFIDLNCHYCSGLYAQLAPLIAQGRLRVNWIPVAILHETSLGKAAEVLQAPDRAQRLAEHEAARDAPTGQGALTAVAPTPPTQTAIQANTELLRVLNKGQLATPMLIFKGRNGEVFQHAGLLRDASDLLNAGS
jgi:thiol:disulfide interchange protein DsbG